MKKMETSILYSFTSFTTYLEKAIVSKYDNIQFDIDQLWFN